SVKQGDKVATMEMAGAEAAAAAPGSPEKSKSETPKPDAPKPAEPTPEQPAAKAESQSKKTSQTITVSIPDIGGAEEVEVIEVTIKPGDVLVAEQTMVVL